MLKSAIAATALLVTLGAAQAQEAVGAFIQLAPTTEYSTISCANFAKLPDGSWHALNGRLYDLGFVHKIVPPVTPIKSGGWIYNNVDLYSQLELQCGGSLVVRARY